MAAEYSLQYINIHFFIQDPFGKTYSRPSLLKFQIFFHCRWLARHCRNQHWSVWTLWNTGPWRTWTEDWVRTECDWSTVFAYLWLKTWSYYITNTPKHTWWMLRAKCHLRVSGVHNLRLVTWILTGVVYCTLQHLQIYCICTCCITDCLGQNPKSINSRNNVETRIDTMKLLLCLSFGTSWISGSA